MRISGIGHIVFALALIALGLLSLGSGDFAFVWQPVPPDIPGREYIAYVSGAVILLCGVGLLIRSTAVLASFALTIYTLIWLLVLHVPHVVAAPGQEMNWGGCAEIVTLVAGSWILYTSTVATHDRLYVASLTGANALRIARILFALAVPLIGLEHLIYSKPTADMVPAWLPGHLFWAYFTGAAHIAAGIAILFAVLPRLAAMLETLMMGIFTVFVWIPAVMATPTQRFAWTALLISTAITAAAWIVTDSYREAPWLSFSRSRGQAVNGAARSA